jgi:hypothetical protein
MCTVQPLTMLLLARRNRRTNGMAYGVSSVLKVRCGAHVVGGSLTHSLTSSITLRHMSLYDRRCRVLRVVLQKIRATSAMAGRKSIARLLLEEPDGQLWCLGRRSLHLDMSPFRQS